MRPLVVGFPRMRKEAGERRDFLPGLIGALTDLGVSVVVERGIGTGMGFGDEDYTSVSPLVRVGSEDEAFACDAVIVLRAPIGRFGKMRPGATLLSMLHFPTRPARVRYLDEIGIEAISLDGIEDDVGRRLVVNGKAVAWNGLEAAFDELERHWPRLTRRDRDPVRVTILGAGEIGRHAVEAATKYGSLQRATRLGRIGCAGIEVTTIGRNVTSWREHVDALLRRTDLLVDATQRHDVSEPVIRNAQIGLMPEHAVICDLAVDPYILDEDPRTVRGIEGIPQGDLDQYAFGADDPAWDEVPQEISTANRRTVVSCYSWPGVHPLPCMELYCRQLEPLVHTLAELGGAAALRPNGPFHERALYRGSLRGWIARTELAAAG